MTRLTEKMIALRIAARRERQLLIRLNVALIAVNIVLITYGLVFIFN
jgi:hypothetical protein